METANELVKVPFHQGEIFAIGQEDTYSVSLKHECAKFGLSFSRQLKKLKARSWAGVAQKATPSAGGLQMTVFIDRRTYVMWLATLDENKIPDPVVRAKVVAHQAEAADALDNYFFRGAAGNQRFALVEQVEALRQQNLELERQRAQFEVERAEVVNRLDAGIRKLKVEKREHRERCHDAGRALRVAYWLDGSDPDDMTCTNLTARGDWYLQSPPKPKNIEQKVWDKAPEKYRRAMFLIFGCDYAEQVVYDLFDKRHSIDPSSFIAWVDNNLGYGWL